MENGFMERRYGSPDGRGRKVLRIIGMVFVGVIFAVLFALVFGLLVKWLWNVLMPGLFGMPQITYLQAFGIIVLAKLLFGSFGSKTHGHNHWTGHSGPFGKWHDRFHCGEEVPWSRRSRNLRRAYRRYWQEEGKAAFDAYMERTDKEGEGGDAQGSGTPEKEGHDD